MLSDIQSKVDAALRKWDEIASPIQEPSKRRHIQSHTRNHMESMAGHIASLEVYLLVRPIYSTSAYRSICNQPGIKRSGDFSAMGFLRLPNTLTNLLSPHAFSTVFAHQSIEVRWNGMVQCAGQYSSMLVLQSRIRLEP